jgi:hypothetical protein
MPKSPKIEVLVATGQPAVDIARTHHFYFGGGRWSHQESIRYLLLVKDNRLRYAADIRSIRRIDDLARVTEPLRERIRLFNAARENYHQEDLAAPFIIIDLKPLEKSVLPAETRYPGPGAFVRGHRYFADLAAFRRAFAGR